MLTDTKIIHRAGPFEVQAQRHEVMWPDGTALALHPVQQHGCGSLMHRAIKLPDGTFVIVDLERTLPPLGAELRRSPARDVPGVVFYTLRQSFSTAQEFQAQAKAVTA